MVSQSNHNSFIFRNEIDADFLFSLYENDYRYVQEIFGITLAQLTPDLQQLDLAYQNQDLASIKKAVHKMKPSFGFVGLNDMQEKCLQFENLCAGAVSVPAIEQQFRQLWQLLLSSQSIIEAEYNRLKSHNAA